MGYSVWAMSVSDHISLRKTIQRKHLFSLISCLFVFLLTAVPAHAETKGATFGGREKVKEMDYSTTTTMEEFLNKSEKYTITPLNDKHLAFEVYLPVSWIPLDSEAEKNDVGGGIFRKLTMFTGPANFVSRSVFRVRTIDLEGLITAENWAYKYMVEMGFAVDGISLQSRRRVEMQYTLFVNTEPMMTRAVIEMTGSRMVIAEYLVHQDNYEAERDQQVLAMKSFHLLTPNTDPAVEMKEYPFVDIAKFSYPMNWTLRAPSINNIERMTASVINVKPKELALLDGAGGDAAFFDGRIDVTLIARRDGMSIRNEVESIKKGLEGHGLLLDKYLGSMIDLKPNPLVGYVRVDAYTLASKDRQIRSYEYWAAFLQTEARIYLVRLITPGREANFPIWATNTETFRYIIESISPPNEKKDDFGGSEEEEESGWDDEKNPSSNLGTP